MSQRLTGNADNRHREELVKEIDELKRYEKNFQAVVEGSIDAMLVVDMDGAILYANPSAEHLFEMARSTLVGTVFGFPVMLSEPVELYVLQRFEKFVAVEMWIVQIYWKGCPAYLVSLRDITRLVRAREELSQYKDRLEQDVRDRTQDLARLIVDLRMEANEHKRAEEALRESEAKYRAIVQQSAVGIARVGLDYRFIDANQRFCDITGYPCDELVRKTFPEITYPEDVDKDLQLIQELVAGKIKDYSLEKRYVRKDGLPVWIVLTTAMVRNQYGSPMYFVAVIQDISQRKQAQQELIDAKNQSDLYVDIMAHDINNLNQVALMNLELLELKENLSEDERGAIGTTINAVRGSANIIENVRRIQKITTEEVHSRPEDLDALIEKCITETPRPGSKTVHIRFEHQKGRMVRGEPILKEAFCNLINNSIKYSGAEVDIDISVEKIETGGKTYYRTSVADNGHGIPDDVKPKLFRRFQRGTTKAQGKGLGLYIVKMLVERFGGTVSVEDRVPGDYSKGAKFAVMLPAVGA